MVDYLVDFKTIEWESPKPGVRQKTFSRDGQRIRLVEFSDTFMETEWCVKGHIGCQNRYLSQAGRIKRGWQLLFGPWLNSMMPLTAAT